MLPVTQIDTFFNGFTLRHYDTINAAARGTFMKRHPEECYDLIENMTTHHNNWDTSAQWSESSNSITSFFDTKIAALKAEMAEINKNLMRVLQGNSYQPQGNRNMLSYRSDNYLGPPAQRSKSSSSITSSSNTEIVALKAEMAEINKNLMRVLQVNQQVKAVTPKCETCGGPHSFSDCHSTVGNTQNVYAAGAYQGNSYQPQGIKETIILRGITREETNSSKELTKFMKMNTASSSGSGSLPVERETEATKDTVHPTNNRSTKDVQPSVVLTESSILNSEPVISPTIEPVASPVSAPRPNQIPLIPYPSKQDQKLRDKANDQQEKFFQIFKDLNFNISFVDALILMPKFCPSIKSLLTNKDKLCELARTPLNEHCSAGLLKKLPEKLRDPDKFLIPCNFLGMAEWLALTDLGASINLMPLSVWNKLPLPNLSLTCMTLELADRSISRPVGVSEDVFVKVGTFHFPADFVVVDFDADPRVPLIIGRSFLKIGRALIDVFEGGLTLRVGKHAITFNLDQTSRYSANYNDMTAKRIDVIDMACEEYSQEVLRFSDVITSGNYLPEVRKELKIYEAKTNKSSIDEPPEVELKDLPPHLKYAFLEGDDKLPIIIVKDLSVKEKSALITVLKSHNDDHFPLTFMDQILERLAGNQYYCFLDGFSGYFQIPINLKDPEKTTFTCPYGMFAYRRMPFGLCNAPGMFQRCMMAIFHDMIEKTMEVFMDDFSVFGNSFQSCPSHLEKMLKRCEDTNLCLNWEKSYFTVKEGIVLGHKISKEGIEVDDPALFTPLFFFKLN
nr:reverse transcriptase domain-containing protein [Tanacetum cinerariifolium]